MAKSKILLNKYINTIVSQTKGDFYWLYLWPLARNSPVSNNGSYWGWNPRKKTFIYPYQSNQPFLHTQLWYTLIDWLWSDAWQALSWDMRTSSCKALHHCDLWLLSSSFFTILSSTSDILKSSINQIWISFSFFSESYKPFHHSIISSTSQMMYCV